MISCKYIIEGKMGKIEQRKTTRRSCLVPVDGKQGTELSEIFSVDISRTGLGFMSKKRLPVNKRIAVEVELGPDQASVIMLGEIKWVRPAGSIENYRVGMKFIKVLASGSRSRLTQYFGDK